MDLYRVALSLALTIYYNVKFAFLLVLYYVTHPFSDPWTPKLRLQPPPILKDPKYGVHKYVKVNNIKMHYVESGDPTKELLIFVHGFPEFWYSWRHQIMDFQKDYWVIAIDQRGYGDSEKPENVEDYKINNMVDDLRDLIKCLGREKCVMIGHDWGAIITWAFRKRYPEMLKAIITLGGTTAEAWVRLVWSNTEQFKMSWYVFFFQGSWIPEMLLRFKDLEIFNKMRGDNVTEEDIECYKYNFGKPGWLTKGLNYYRAIPPQSSSEEVSMDQLDIPALAILGGNDKYLVKENLEETKKEYKNVETILLENLGHFIPETHPEKTNTILRDYLKKWKL